MQNEEVSTFQGPAFPLLSNTPADGRSRPRPIPRLIGELAGLPLMDRGIEDAWWELRLDPPYQMLLGSGPLPALRARPHGTSSVPRLTNSGPVALADITRCFDLPSGHKGLLKSLYLCPCLLS